MSTSPAPYFFMSYSREDTVKQRRIIKELRQRGVNIWVDVENLTPGTPTWEREIEKAIRSSTGIIVLLSPESNNSEWVRRELSFGEHHRNAAARAATRSAAVEGQTVERQSALDARTRRRTPGQSGVFRVS